MDKANHRDSHQADCHAGELGEEYEHYEAHAKGKGRSCCSFIIFMFQSSDMAKRASVLLGADANSASVFPLPEGGVPPLEKEVVAEVKEASGTFEIQHAKLQPGWKQVNFSFNTEWFSGRSQLTPRSGFHHDRFLTQRLERTIISMRNQVRRHGIAQSQLECKRGLLW